MEKLRSPWNSQKRLIMIYRLQRWLTMLISSPSVRESPTMNAWPEDFWKLTSTNILLQVNKTTNWGAIYWRNALRLLCLLLGTQTSQFAKMILIEPVLMKSSRIWNLTKMNIARDHALSKNSNLRKSRFVPIPHQIIFHSVIILSCLHLYVGYSPKNLLRQLIGNTGLWQGCRLLAMSEAH